MIVTINIELLADDGTKVYSKEHLDTLYTEAEQALLYMNDKGILVSGDGYNDILDILKFNIDKAAEKRLRTQKMIDILDELAGCENLDPVDMEFIEYDSGYYQCKKEYNIPLDKDDNNLLVARIEQLRDLKKTQ